jgi:hypothetical protein
VSGIDPQPGLPDVGVALEGDVDHLTQCRRPLRRDARERAELDTHEHPEPEPSRS